MHFLTDYARVKRVGSFEELVSVPFVDGVNAACWVRTLPGDFAQVARLLATGPGITTIDNEQLRALAAGKDGRIAIEVLLEDQRLLRELDLAPVLDCINGYERESSDSPVATDVYSFHADSATEPMDTYLCTYLGPSSEGLRNEDALRKVDLPEIRAQLLALYGDADDAGFEEFLAENYFDLHYAAVAGAIPFSFGLYHLWRIGVEYPGSPVPPCIHRAPETKPGDPPRLLLIS
jgi:hypothetical protein